MSDWPSPGQLLLGYLMVKGVKRLGRALRTTPTADAAAKAFERELHQQRRDQLQVRINQLSTPDLFNPIQRRRT
jgi:hypothetical protein